MSAMILGVSGSISAEGKPCDADKSKMCSKAKSEKDVADCLKKNEAKLSADCKKEINKPAAAPATAQPKKK